MHLDNDQAVVSGCGGLAVADVCIIIPIILISLLIISRINFVASSMIVPGFTLTSMFSAFQTQLQFAESTPLW